MACASILACAAMQVVVGRKLDDIYMVMEYMEHDLKKLQESMKQPLLHLRGALPSGAEDACTTHCFGFILSRTCALLCSFYLGRHLKSQHW